MTSETNEQKARQALMRSRSMRGIRSVGDIRRNGVTRLLRKFRGSPREARRLQDYCDAAYRIGYRQALNKLTRKRREQKLRDDEYRSRRGAPSHIIIETDTAMECPICQAEILPGVKHEHGTGVIE